MTNDEFTKFAKTLFVAFPSLWEWLQKNSPDAKATQEVWRETLRPYSLAECCGVVSSWTSGKLEAFKAYERDQVHLMIRSICELSRDRQHRKKSQTEANRPYHDKRKATMQGEHISTGSLMDCAMVAAVKEGAIHHKRLIDGEITQSEYERLREDVLGRRGVGTVSCNACRGGSC